MKNRFLKIDYLKSASKKFVLKISDFYVYFGKISVLYDFSAL